MVVRFRGGVGAGSYGSMRPSARRSSQASASQDMKKVVEKYRRWMAHVNEQLEPALIEAFQPTVEKIKMYTPYEFGDLRASVYLQTRRRQGKVELEVGAGRGGNPDYAIYVHERVDLKHKSPTRAKFVQAALEEDNLAVQQRLIDGIKKASGV